MVHCTKRRRKKRTSRREINLKEKRKKPDTGLQIMIFISLIVIIIAALVILVPQPPYEKKYYAGEIYVYFYSRVGFQNASHVIENEFNCKILSHSFMRNQTGSYIEFRVKVPEWREKEYVKKFAQHPWVSEARLSYAE